MQARRTAGAGEAGVCGGDPLPQMRRRTHCGKAHQETQNFLRLFGLSRLRLRPLGQTHRRKMREVRRVDDHHQTQTGKVLQQGMFVKCKVEKSK